METQRLSIRAAEGTWVVRASDAVIGESSNAVEVADGNLPVEIYFPREDLAMAFFEPSATRSSSRRKGEATHFDIMGQSGPIRDAGWSFESPSPEAERIAGLIAFDCEKVAVEQV